MIVCHCNVLTHAQVLETLKDEPAQSPRSPVQAYRCLGCSPDCGRCIPTVREILREARAVAGAALSACHVGCPTCPNAEAHPPRIVAEVDVIEVDVIEIDMAAEFVTKSDHVEIEHVDLRIRGAHVTLAAAE
jgi:bacterioferritin-associated ferredoxin